MKRVEVEAPQSGVDLAGTSAKPKKSKKKASSSNKTGEKKKKKSSSSSSSSSSSKKDTTTKAAASHPPTTTTTGKGDSESPGDSSPGGSKNARGAASSCVKRRRARRRARVLCRVMELRISIARYFLQEAQYMDRVRSRVALSLGAFDESGEWKYGRKVLSALDSFGARRDRPEELLHDLALLRDLEAELDDDDDDDPSKRDIPDDDVDELLACLRDDVHALRARLDVERSAVAKLRGVLDDKDAVVDDDDDHVTNWPTPPPPQNPPGDDSTHPLSVHSAEAPPRPPRPPNDRSHE